MISPDEVLVWFSRKYGRMSQWGSSRVPSYPFAQSSAFIVFSARPISYTPPFLCQRPSVSLIGQAGDARISITIYTMAERHPGSILIRGELWTADGVLD